MALSPATPAPFKNQAALIVYDAPGIRYVLRRMVERMGLEVVEARTGKYGQMIASGRRLALIILDFHLPDDDGLSLAQKLRRQHSDATIVLTSAATTAQPGLEHAAVDGFLLQPFDATTPAQIADLMAARAAARALE